MTNISLHADLNLRILQVTNPLHPHIRPAFNGWGVLYSYYAKIPPFRTYSLTHTSTKSLFFYKKVCKTIVFIIFCYYFRIRNRQKESFYVQQHVYP